MLPENDVDALLVSIVVDGVLHDPGGRRQLVVELAHEVLLAILGHL